MEAAEYRLQVFINCPFDRAYRKLFYAIVFAVKHCGYDARSALEISDAGELRLAKIFRIISACALGIHDISRTELDSRSRLPRFNMPLELGMFLAAREFGDAQQRAKICLVLDRAPHRYEKFCSDIKGCDISSHRRNPETAIYVVRDFLRGVRPKVTLPGGKFICRSYAKFLKTLPAGCQEVGLRTNDLTFNDYATFVARWLKQTEDSV
ncbi:MAG: hypothetical protein M3Z22_01260 [Verrucomicrobiota bacterium]|nr:hypothetical protein [Verrucomicrobiota bacterium]